MGFYSCFPIRKIDRMIKDFDFTWQNPTPKQLALLKRFQSGFPAGIKQRQAVEFIVTARDSMWYLEVKRYASAVFPLDITKDDIKFFIEGCINICEVVEKEYNLERDAWWSIKKPENDKELVEVNRYLFAMANSINTLQSMNKGNKLLVEMLETFARIMLGNDWNKRFYEAVNLSKTTREGYKYKHGSKTNGKDYQEPNLN